MKLLEFIRFDVVMTMINLVFFFFFLKSTIYYMRHDDSLCLQEELCIEYQYPNLFYAVTQYKGLLRN